MNLASGFYLIVTCAGLVAVIASLRITDFRPRRLALFVVGGTIALAALSSFFVVYQLFQAATSASEPFYVAGVPFNLHMMYALTSAGSAATAGFARWSPVGTSPRQRKS
jgi:hypothetical protein